MEAREKKPYACPECGWDEMIAANAVEHKLVYIDGDGNVFDERSGGHTDFLDFRCTRCETQWTTGG